MGADMLVYLLPDCELTNERLQALKEAFGNLTDDERSALVGPQCGLKSLGYESSEDALAACAEEYGDFKYRRDVAQVMPPNSELHWLVTGGLSWGDHPTDSCESFELLGECAPAFDLLLKWAIEDRPRWFEINRRREVNQT